MSNEQKLREAFEARMTYNGKWPNAIAKCRNGSYLLAHTENAWTEWLACAEALAQPADGTQAAAYIENGVLVHCTLPVGFTGPLYTSPQAGKPAEGGEVDNVKSSAGLIRPGKVDAWVANHYTAPPASQEQAQQPQALMDAWGISHALAKLFAGEYMGAKLATIELATKPQAQASRSRLVDIDDLKDAIQSIEDYRSGVDFGSHDRKLLGRLKAALATQPQAQYHLPDAGKMVAQELPDERAAFERSLIDRYGWERKDFKRDQHGGYLDGQTDTAWMAWQLRAALAAKPVPEPTLSALMGQDVTREQWERFKHWEAQELCPAR